MTRAIEITEFTISPEQGDRFERALREALPILDRQPGLVRREFGRTLEGRDAFFLLVEWRSLADHVDRFRGSADFAAFTGYFRPLLAKPSRVVHIEPQDG